MAKAKYQGLDIREVWDFRLSIGCPYLFNSGPTWVIKIIANESPDDGPAILEEIVTDIPTGDPRDPGAIIAGQAACYPILREIRDKYSRPDIEARREMAAAIREKNAKLAEAMQS